MCIWCVLEDLESYYICTVLLVVINRVAALYANNGSTTSTCACKHKHCYNHAD